MENTAILPKKNPSLSPGMQLPWDCSQTGTANKAPALFLHQFSSAQLLELPRFPPAPSPSRSSRTHLEAAELQPLLGKENGEMAALEKLWRMGVRG